MNPEKDMWINEALDSIEGIQPAQSENNFYDKVMQRIESGNRITASETISMANVYKIAAAILLIVTLNAFTCINFSKSKVEQQNLTAFAHEFSLTGNNYNF